MYRKWWIFYDYLLISIGEREKDRMANEKTDVKERKRRTDRHRQQTDLEMVLTPPLPRKIKIQCRMPQHLVNSL